MRIVATGTAVPGTRRTAEELDQELGLPPGSSFKATGIRERYLSSTETAASLAADACRATLAAAGISWDGIDCLVAASGTMDQALPYNAAMIHAELGLSERRTTTFDIGASCMSFLTALDICSALLAAGRFRRILIVSSDISTFTTDRANLRENGIFGDGAAACLVRAAAPGESSAVLASDSITLSEGVDYCRIPGGGSRFHRRGPAPEREVLFEMKPKPLFGVVAAHLPGFVETLLRRAGITMGGIDLVVPHQASPAALKHIVRLLRIPPGKLVDISATRANQVGASLPTALHHGLAERNIPRGSTVLLLGSGAGVTIGGMILTY